MEDMTWPDIKEAMEKGYTTVVTGIGSTEQHGPHLPTKTDTSIGDNIAFRVAEKLGKALQAKTICVGCSEHHLAFPGTLSLRAETLKNIIDDYTDSLVKQGFNTIIYLPSHGGNFAAVKEAIAGQQEKYPAVKIIGYTDLLSFVECLYKISEEFKITRDEAGAHAGENETSIMLTLAGDLVRKDRFASGYLGELGEKEINIILDKGMPALSKIGVLGDPRKASSEKGEVYLERTADFLVGEIKKQLA
jgi:creatinine amidohydrolase